MENFADSPIILDMCDNIRLPAVDALYLKGQHHNINIICAGHTITDLNPQSRDRTPVVYITLISSKLFIEREEKLYIDSNFHRFKHYDYGIIKYNLIDNYYIVLGKNKVFF